MRRPLRRLHGHGTRWRSSDENIELVGTASADPSLMLKARRRGKDERQVESVVKGQRVGEGACW